MGEISRINLRIEVLQTRFSSETSELGLIDNISSDIYLKEVIKERITKNLGSDYYLQDFTVQQGSIEILIIIGTIYSFIKEYKTFREGIRLLKSDIESIFSFFLKPKADVRISSNVTISPNAKMDDNQTITKESKKELPQININNYALLILIIYLFITNIIMLFFLMSKYKN